jgi:hypothetical protein
MAPIYKFIRGFLKKGPRPSVDDIRQFVTACVAYYTDGRSVAEFIAPAPPLAQPLRALCILYPHVQLTLMPKTVDAKPAVSVSLDAGIIDRCLFAATLAMPDLDRVHSYDAEIGPPPSQAMFNSLFARNADISFLKDWRSQCTETWYGATLQYDPKNFINCNIKLPGAKDWLPVANIPLDNK